MFVLFYTQLLTIWWLQLPKIHCVPTWELSLFLHWYYGVNMIRYNLPLLWQCSFLHSAQKRMSGMGGVGGCHLNNNLKYNSAETLQTLHNSIQETVCHWSEWFKAVDMADWQRQVVKIYDTPWLVLNLSGAALRSHCFGIPEVVPQFGKKLHGC